MKTRAKRRKHSAAFKATVAMEAGLGIKTVAQIAREHSVHPVQVSQWKTVLRERMPELFEAGDNRRPPCSGPDPTHPRGSVQSGPWP